MDFVLDYSFVDSFACYFGKPDTKKAVVLYERAARGGVQNAIKSLISLYHGGFGGFPKNIQKEQYWRARLK